mgnify:CR=1 FL=1
MLILLTIPILFYIVDRACKAYDVHRVANDYGSMCGFALLYNSL